MFTTFIDGKLRRICRYSVFSENLMVSITLKKSFREH